VSGFTRLVRFGLEFRVVGYGFGLIHSSPVRLWLGFRLLGFIIFSLVISYLLAFHVDLVWLGLGFDVYGVRVGLRRLHVDMHVGSRLLHEIRVLNECGS
jgi:hypothetical protein